MCFLFIFLNILSTCSSQSGTFPPDFQFGVTTASYQIEGAWNEDGKSENLWDRVTHTHPEIIADHSTGDVSADSYHHLDRDLGMLKRLGVNSYRFSLSWTRLLPNGFPNEINNAGLDYYNRLVNGLLDAGIEPIVTLLHFDLPLKFQKLGGWNNPESISWFKDYADFVLSQFADRVRYWITLNQPLIYCNTITTWEVPEGYIDPERAPFVCTKNQLLGHAAVYRLFTEKYSWKNNGKMSLTNLYAWYESPSNNEEEQDIIDILLEYEFGRFNHPIYSKEGGWPTLLIDYMESYSKQKGYNTSLLPAFTEEEKEFVKGSADFLAMNEYCSYVTHTGSIESEDLTHVKEPETWREKMQDAFLKVNGTSMTMYEDSRGLRHIINWTRTNYGDWDILITENGFSNGNRSLEDSGRINYLKSYLEQVSLVIHEDHHNVLGYSVWALMDTFEWKSGYTSKFGLYDIDFNDPNQRETMRSSGVYYSCIIKHRNLNDCASLLTPVIKD